MTDAMAKGERRGMRKVARLVGAIETRKLIEWHRAEAAGATRLARAFHEEAAKVLSSITFDEPACALCGDDLIPGLNTDFCSLACEEAWRATQPDDLDAPDINGQE